MGWLYKLLLGACLDHCLRQKRLKVEGDCISGSNHPVVPCQLKKMALSPSSTLISALFANQPSVLDRLAEEKGIPGEKAGRPR